MSAEQTYKKLLAYAVSIEHDGLRQIASLVVNDVRFHAGFGARSHHHAYRSGLMVHTLEVTSCVDALSSERTDVSRDVLVTAAIIHDYHKIYDYAWVDGHVEGTAHRDQINHVSGTFAWFMKQADTFGIADDLRRAIGHCLLAHHGRKEWGSPVEPQTVEAYMLHAADMISSHFPQVPTLVGRDPESTLPE